MDWFPGWVGAIQKVKYEGGLRSCRMQLVETFYHILKKGENMVQKVLVPTWDSLIQMFLNYKLNSNYQNYFYLIMKVVAEQAS